MRDQILFVERYRPTKIDDCILPDSLKRTFKDIVIQGDVPNMILSGSSGCGKTTICKAIANELDCDFMLINASESGNIDTLRTVIKSFSSTVSLHGGRKMLILDEADYLNPNSTQPALRGFMEEFASNTAFVLTCNYKNRLIPAIHSRCSVVDFKIENKDKPKLASQFMKRVQMILDTEKITYSDKVIAALISRHFPDFRRVLNEIQRYSVGGKIDEGILSRVGEIKVTELIQGMKAKDFDKVRKWVLDNLDNDSSRIFRQIYDSLYTHFEENSIPIAILKLADYQYKSAFAADQEINLLAFLVELMVECEIKG